MISYRKIIIIFITVIALVAVVFLGLLFQKRQQPLPDSSGLGSLSGPTAQQQKILDEANANFKELEKNDSDLDGISNEEETRLGTNLVSVDSDSDGLLDKDEIEIWKTDPLKADTDGDGHADGYEVRRGYNPLGAGKIKY